MILMKCGVCKGTGILVDSKAEKTNNQISEICTDCNGEGFVEYILSTKEIKKLIITKSI